MTRGSHLKDTDRGDWQQIKLRHVAKKKKKEKREKNTQIHIYKIAIIYIYVYFPHDGPFPWTTTMDKGATDGVTVHLAVHKRPSVRSLSIKGRP